MSITRGFTSLTAALSLCGAVAIAESAQQPPTTTEQKASTDSPIVMIAGCVQKETDVLKRSPAATNAGMGDEFVLTNAALNPASSATDRPPTDVTNPPTTPTEPAATSGSSGNLGRVYRVTGDKEADLKGFVGQRVEITGTFKDKDAVKDQVSSVGTSGRTGDLTPANTPEVIVTAVKPVAGTCAPAIK